MKSSYGKCRILFFSGTLILCIGQVSWTTLTHGTETDRDIELVFWSSTYSAIAEKAHITPRVLSEIRKIF